MNALNRDCFFYGYLLLILIAGGCTRLPVQPSQNRAPAARYHISVPVIDEDSILFSLDVTEGNSFILPFHFFDNPVDSINGSLIRDMSVVDAEGNPVDTTMSTARIGPIDNRLVHLSTAAHYPVTISYRLNLDAIHPPSVKRYLPLVHIKESSLFLIGLFICPPQRTTP